MRNKIVSSPNALRLFNEAARKAGWIVEMSEGHPLNRAEYQACRAFSETARKAGWVVDMSAGAPLNRAEHQARMVFLAEWRTNNDGSRN